MRLKRFAGVSKGAFDPLRQTLMIEASAFSGKVELGYLRPETALA
jgi:hypothetical protein